MIASWLAFGVMTPITNGIGPMPHLTFHKCSNWQWLLAMVRVQHKTVLGYVGMRITCHKRYASKIVYKKLAEGEAMNNNIWEQIKCALKNPSHPFWIYYVSRPIIEKKRKEREQYVPWYLLSGIDLEISCLHWAYLPSQLEQPPSKSALGIFQHTLQHTIILMKRQTIHNVK